MADQHPDLLGRVYVDLDDFANLDLQSRLVRWLDVQNAWPGVQPSKRRIEALLGVTAGDIVLDVGCGTGDDSRALARAAGENGRVIGVDVSTVMVEEAQQRLQPHEHTVTFQVGDITHLTFADGTFDRVRSERTFQWVADPSAALAELCRVTKPGGRLVVTDTDWSTAIWGAGDPELGRTVAAFWNTRVPHARIGSALPHLFEQAGLTDIQIEPHLIVLNASDYGPEYAWTFQRVATKAHGAGVVTDADVTRWGAALDEAARAGTFFSATTVFIVAGTKASAQHQEA